MISDQKVNRRSFLKTILTMNMLACIPFGGYIGSNILTTRRNRKEESFPYVPTGFSALDRMIGGLHPSDLIIIAGRPSTGKSTFSMNIARNVAMLEKGAVPVGIFSLEMSKEQIVQRFLSLESQLEHAHLKNGMISDAQWQKLTHAAGKLSEAHIFIDDSLDLSVPYNLKERARRLKKEHGIGLLMIDYLQLLWPGNVLAEVEERSQEMSMFLKPLAKELNIPVIAVSKLRRWIDWRKRPVPRLSDLKKSGVREQDADVVMFTYGHASAQKKSESNKAAVEIIVAKNRSGPTGPVEVTFGS
jgi:replicative DNA helicase